MQLRFTLENIHEAARQFLDVTKDMGTCFAFYAPMGAGKTTFIKALCEELGVEDVITSPTFAIVNEYTGSNGKWKMENGKSGAPQGEFSVFHFDFYRIKKMEELYDMGADDYFYSGNLCLMEWPEIVENALPEETVKVTITPQADGSRILEV